MHIGYSIEIAKKVMLEKKLAIRRRSVDAPEKSLGASKRQPAIHPYHSPRAISVMVYTKKDTHALKRPNRVPASLPLTGEGRDSPIGRDRTGAQIV